MMKSSSLLSQTLLTLLLISTSTTTTTTLAIDEDQQNTAFIQHSCTTTTYPKVCFATLSGYASQVQTSPKLLATMSLTVAHSAAQSASSMMGRLSRISSLTPAVEAALSDCSMAVENSEAQLQRAVDEIGLGGEAAQSQPSAMVVSDVQTWTSTALTYAGTCMDGFSGSETDGNVKIIVRGQILKLTQLISNGLALLNTYASSRNSHH